MIGKLSENVLEAVLETIPMEFSIVDANDKVLAWNKHKTRIFKRVISVLAEMSLTVIRKRVWIK